MHSLSLLSLAPLYFLSACIFSGAQAAVLNDETDAFINQLLVDWGSPGGVGVAVVVKDSQGTWNVETKGYGIATANGSKVTENTLFAIGSNSKLFNIIATGLLISNETLSPRLSWTSKVASVIPNWDLSDSTATKQATIIDLMSHRTGLPRHDFSYKWSDNAPDVIKKLKSQRPSAEFRDVFQYNNNMYTVLSYLPTLLLPSKLPFARYVKKYIFEPLGMSSTTYSYEVALSIGNLADGMARQNTNISDPLGGIPRALPYWSTTGGEDGNVLSGAGGIISNSVDMATWLQTLLQDGVKPGTDSVVIPAAVLQKVSTGVSVASGAASLPELSPNTYGGGQLQSTYRGHAVVEHDGGTPGFISLITRLPFDNIGVAVLSNDNDYGDPITNIIRWRLLDQALGLEKVDWNARFKSIIPLTAPPPATPRPVNATSPSIELASIAGVYSNGGYGPVELCLASPTNPAASPSCKALTSNLTTILPGAVDPKIPSLIGEWNSPWMSHIRLNHFNGNIFNVSALISFPTNNASDSESHWVSGVSTSVDSQALAEIVVDGRRISLGLSGIWGAGSGIPSPQGKTPRERAETWFDKL